MWRILAESVAGTSHTAKAAACQDAHAVRVLEGANGPTLVVAVADGAGSARFGEIGADIACNALQAGARNALAADASVSGLTRDAVVGWLLRAKSEVLREADLRCVRPRELACTALLAVIGESAAVFAQVGDGAVVVPDQNGYVPVFWPAPAEYANVTDFLTDEGVEDRIVCEVVLDRIDEVAVLTDGLQRLALDFTTRRGHSKFFAPLLTTLREQPLTGPLANSFREFLNSAQINARTDDDKTLVIAARSAPATPTTC